MSNSRSSGAFPARAASPPRCWSGAYRLRFLDRQHPFPGLFRLSAVACLRPVLGRKNHPCAPFPAAEGKVFPKDDGYMPSSGSGATPIRPNRRFFSPSAIPSRYMPSSPRLRPRFRVSSRRQDRQLKQGQSIFRLSRLASAGCAGRSSGRGTRRASLPVSR